MSNARSFAPWIAYAIVSSVLDWRAAAAIALVVAIRAIRRDRREHDDVDDLTRATGWFFAGLTALSVLDPTSPLHRFTPALSLATLGIAATWSLIRSEPFTMTFAKRTAPPEVWDEPLFIDANVTITTVWAISFLGTAAACAAVLAVAPSATLLWVAIEALGFIVPMRFTVRARQRARARFAAATA
jgi:hypothetical protein